MTDKPVQCTTYSWCREGAPGDFHSIGYHAGGFAHLNETSGHARLLDTGTGEVRVHMWADGDPSDGEIYSLKQIASVRYVLEALGCMKAAGVLNELLVTAGASTTKAGK